MSPRRRLFTLISILIVTAVFAVMTTAATHSAPQTMGGGAPTADIFIDGLGNGDDSGLYPLGLLFLSPSPDPISLKFDLGGSLSGRLATGGPNSISSA